MTGIASELDKGSVSVRRHRQIQTCSRHARLHVCIGFLNLTIRTAGTAVSIHHICDADFTASILWWEYLVCMTWGLHVWGATVRFGPVLDTPPSTSALEIQQLNIEHANYPVSSHHVCAALRPASITLTGLASLHDVGSVNVGRHHQIWTSASHPILHFCIVVATSTYPAHMQSLTC